MRSPAAERGFKFTSGPKPSPFPKMPPMGSIHDHIRQGNNKLMSWTEIPGFGRQGHQRPVSAPLRRC
jgi:hypothetical protein